MENKKQGFIKGALILSLSGFLVKIIGVLFRIPLTNLVGSAAMSYYSSAYSVYVLLLSVSTSGLPTGISVIVSRFSALRQNRSVMKTMRISLAIFVSFGLILSILGSIFSENIALTMNSSEAWYSVIAIMPSIFFISVVSVFRGFFQGLNNMTPTAVSNIIEACSKLIFGYGFSFWLYTHGYPEEIIVGGAIFGVTVGTVLSSLYMLIAYFVKRKKIYGLSRKITKENISGRFIFKNLMMITLPLMLSSVTSNLMGTIDAFLVMSRMKEYLPLEMAKLNWGAYANMSQTVFNLPSFIIISLGTSLVPSISSAFTLRRGNELRGTIEKAFKYTSIIAFGSAFSLYLLSDNFLSILFGGDPEGVFVAVPLLQILAFALISVGFTNISASVLHSLGKSYLSVFSVAVGAVVKTFATYILVSVPEINIAGAPLATNIAYPVMMLLNIVFIRKNLGFLPGFFKNIFLPFLAASFTFLSAYLIFPYFSCFLPLFSNTILSVFLIFIVYISLLFFVGALNFCDFLRIFTKRKKSS